LTSVVSGGVDLQEGAMSDRCFTETVVRAAFELDAIDAIRHARCGPNAPCRRDALARCDDDLDDYLALASQDVGDVSPSPVPH
jgi:hypothetical protein